MYVKRDITQNFVALLSASTIERVFLAVTVMIVARQVGPADFGPYAASFALTRILAVAFSLGLDTWLLRNGFREGDYSQLTKHSTSCLTIKLILGAFWLAAMLALTTFLNPEVFPPLFILLCALTVLFEEVANTVWTSARAALRNQQIVKFIIPGQVLLLGAVAVIAVRGSDSAADYLLAQTAITALIAFAALIWQRRTLGFRLQPDLLIPTLRGTLVFGLSLGLTMIYGRADVALVAYFLGPEAAGLYSPAVSIMSALVLVPLALNMVMIPAMSRLHEEGAATIRGMASRLILFSAPIGILSGLVLAFGADWIVQILLGDAYAETGDVLSVLSGVLSARFITLAAASVLVAVGWQRHRVKPQAVVAALNVGMNVLLIPRWGIMGAAGVFVFTEWLLVAGYVSLVWRWNQLIGGKAPVAGS